LLTTLVSAVIHLGLDIVKVFEAFFYSKIAEVGIVVEANTRRFKMTEFA
jgi:hypothetical protein